MYFSILILSIIVGSLFVYGSKYVGLEDLV
jgi:hypothetical protein